MFNHREAAYALLRVTLGVVFLFYGVGKLMGGVGSFAAGMEKHFAGKLPGALVLSGLLLVALTFGTVMLGDAPTVAHNLQYALINFVLLWFADYNGFSV